MTSRKPVASLSPAAARTTKSPSTLSSEYAEAIQFLNDVTMKQACEWVLDDEDMDGDEKLLETYYKCEDALKIIQKQQPALSSLTASPIPPPPGAASLSTAGNRSNLQQQSTSQSQSQGQASHRGSLPKLTSLAATKKPIAKGGVIPMRRTALTKPRMGRAESGGGSSDDLTPSQPHAKKARMAAQGVPTQQHPDNPRAPPPAALNFLAKLNKDGNGVPASGNGNSIANSGANGNGSPVKPTGPSNAKRNPPRSAHRRGT